MHFGILLIVTVFGLRLLAAEVTGEVKELESKLPTVRGKEKFRVLTRLSEANFGTSSKNTIKYAREALELAQEINDIKGKAKALRHIGIGYYYQCDYDRALGFYIESLRVCEEIGDKLEIANSSHRIGAIFKELKLYDKAFSYLERSLKLAKEIKAKDVIQLIYINLSEIHSELGDNKKALEFYKQYSEVKDSVYTERSSKKIAEMQTKYESDKKEKEIELLKKDNIIEQSRKRMLIIFLFVTLSIVIFLFYLYRMKIGMNKKLDLLSTLLIHTEVIISRLDVQGLRVRVKITSHSMRAGSCSSTSAA
jgi:tetratricopeptide (TPR) repeat protein